MYVNGYEIKPGADLRRANFWGDELSGAELSGANLSGANLGRANLGKANLQGANLQGANLSGADLWEANLSGADLSMADIREADFPEANLRNANFWGANLRGAFFQGAELLGARFRRTKGIIDAGMSSRGFRHIAIQQSDGFMMRNGCHYFSMKKAREYWGKNYKGNANKEEINAILDFIEIRARILGWIK